MQISIQLKEKSISGLPAVQSFAWASNGDKWLIVGGKLTGLHGYRPPDAFPLQDFNTKLTVVDLPNNRVIQASFSDLPDSIAEHLSATNMQFTQYNGRLYLFGGYGFSTVRNKYVTFPYLTVINLQDCIKAIFQGKSVSGAIRHYYDERFAVCGGDLEIMNNRFYLVGGQLFDGRYNKGGMTSYSQQYTHAIASFLVSDNGQSLSISDYRKIVNEDVLHRRDFNLLPVITAQREPALMLFSGVFQKNADLPYLNGVQISTDTFVLRDDMMQRLNQYHTASVALFDSVHNTMHQLFFGGIGQYIFDTTTNTYNSDSLVPFVNTISRMIRNSQDSFSEDVLGYMPGLMGANAEFIPDKDISEFENGVIKLNDLNTNQRIGYIYGGIISSAPNVFNLSSDKSIASNKIYEVYLQKSKVSAIAFNMESNVKLNVFPNPVSGSLTIEVDNYNLKYLKLGIYDFNGNLVKQLNKPATFIPGKYFWYFDTRMLAKGVFFIKLVAENKSFLKKIIVE